MAARRAMSLKGIEISFRAFLELRYQKLTLLIHVIVIVCDVPCTVVADEVRYTVHIYIPS